MLSTEPSALALFFTEKLPRILFSLISKSCGSKGVDLVKKVTDKFLVLLYLVVVLGAWSVMFTYGYAFMERSPHVDSRHKLSGYVVFLTCMWSWRKAGSSSPGYITERSIPKYDNYPYDNLLYAKKKCPTMGFRKLPRSKYDRYTNRHVARFDHFCGWIDNTVGEENYCFFLLFLLVHIGMCLYGTIVTYHLFNGEIQDMDLFNAVFYNAETGEEVQADFWVVSHFMFMKHFQLCGVFVLMGAMTLVLGLFFLFHLYMASKGMTTNEYYKWRQVKTWHKKETHKFMEAVLEGKMKDVRLNSQNEHAGIGEMPDVDVGCVGPIDPTKSTSKDEQRPNNSNTDIMDPGPFPKNIYDLGAVENLKEIIFPRSLRLDAKERYATALRSARSEASTASNVEASKKTKNT
jgi:palmitoyltransferase